MQKLALRSLKYIPLFIALMSIPAAAQFGMGEAGKPMQIAPVTVHHDVAIRVVAGQTAERPRPHKRLNKRPRVAPLPVARPAAAPQPEAPKVAAPAHAAKKGKPSLFERAKWGIIRSYMRLRARLSRH